MLEYWCIEHGILQNKQDMRTKYHAYFEKCAEITELRIDLCNLQILRNHRQCYKHRVKEWLSREIFWNRRNCPSQFCIETYGSLWVRLLYKQKLKKDNICLNQSVGSYFLSIPTLPPNSSTDELIYGK